MQFLFDHLTAVFVAAILLMIIATILLRGRTSSIDSTQYNAAKRGVLDLVQVVEQDFTNIGSGFNPPANSIQDFDTTGIVKYIEFMARPIRTQAAPSLIRYEWTASDPVYVKGKGQIPAYRVRRLIDGAESGATMDTFTNVQIGLMTADSVDVGANWQNTRLMHVSLTAVSPVGVSSDFQETNWSKFFRPVNLTRQ